MLILVFLIFILIMLRILGLVSYSKKIVVNGYLEVFLDEENKIFVKIRKKILYFFNCEKKYEIKYVRGKNNFEEIKKYFDKTLKNKEFILKEINSPKFFDFRKKAIIFLRDSIVALNKIPIVFLPETELKSLNQEMIKIGIVDIEKNDFSTFLEKLLYLKFKKFGEKYEEKNC